MGGIHHHGFGFVDPLEGIDSPLRRLPATAKLLGAVALVTLLVLTPVKAATLATVFPAVFLVLVAACGAGFVPPLWVVRRVLTLEPVVIAAACLALWQPDGTRVFAAVVLRSTLCVATMVVLGCSTPFPELLDALRRLRLPSVMVTTLALTFRYAFLLGEEHQRLRRARASRSVARAPWRDAWTSGAALVGQLFVRTADRADRVYAAMIARGWR